MKTASGRGVTIAAARGSNFRAPELDLHIAIDGSVHYSDEERETADISRSCHEFGSNFYWRATPRPVVRSGV